MSPSTLPADLTDTEKQLVEAAQKGEFADYTTGEPELDDPANGADWGDERTIRAEVIYALAVGDNPQVHAKGVRILGAKIADPLDLRAVKIPHPLTLVDCFIGEPITLRDADALSVNLTGSHVAGIVAEGLRSRGGVFLRNGFRATSEVRLLGARIGGNLECASGGFENAKGYALNADGATIGGDVLLGNGFHATGAVRLVGTRIGGQLSCWGGSFDNANGDALNADSAAVDGSVFLDDGFHAKGEVRLLAGARIGGNLTCAGGTFENPNAKALNADGATIDGAVFLGRGFQAKGEVRLLGAKIGGQIDCSGGTFENPNAKALIVDGATVDGAVFLRDKFYARGEVRLTGAKIGGQLSCSGGTFENPNGYALDAERAGVTAALFFGELRSPPTGIVNLAYAQVGELVDNEKSWPERGKLGLDGFVYGRLAGDAPWRAHDWKDDKGVLRKGRLYWLSLQPDFRPQSYEQLIRVLREMGHEREARDVAIAKQVQLRKHGGLGLRSQLWSLLLGFTIAHGYKGGRAFGLLIAAWIIGTGMFYLSERSGVMVPSEEQAYVSYQCGWGSLPPGYPTFHAPLYALDVFVPGIDLHQKSKWSLHERDAAGRWYWLWGFGSVVYFVACWVLTLIGVAAVTAQATRQL